MALSFNFSDFWLHFFIEFFLIDRVDVFAEGLGLDFLFYDIEQTLISLSEGEFEAGNIAAFGWWDFAKTVCGC